MANVIVFPLLRLPTTSVKNVIQRMDPVQQLTFSICSKVTKNLVKCFGRKADQVNFMLHYHFSMEIFFRNYRIRMTFRSDKFPPDLKLAVDYIQAYTRFNEIPIYWKNPKLGVRDWLEHFLSVTKSRGIEGCIVYEENFQIDSIRDVLSGLSIYRILIGHSSIKYMRNILSIFNSTRSLTLYGYSLSDFPKTVTKNLDNIELMNISRITIDDILMTNSTHLKICMPNLNEKDLNKLLKLWMTGSCPRLKYLHIEFIHENRQFQEQVLLKGIKYHMMEGEKTFQMFPKNALYRDEKVVNDGFVITRNDRTEATIGVESLGKTTWIDVYIWS